MNANVIAEMTGFQMDLNISLSNTGELQIISSPEKRGDLDAGKHQQEYIPDCLERMSSSFQANSKPS